MIVLTSLEEVAEDFLYLCVEMDRRGRRFEEGDDCWCARKNDDDRRIHLFFLVLTKVETRNFFTMTRFKMPMIVTMPTS